MICVTVATCGSLKRYLIFLSCVDQMKTPDFDAEARYAPLGERHSAVIAPDISLDVYTADFDQVDFDTEMISGSRDQNVLQRIIPKQTYRVSGWPPQNIARKDATTQNNHDNIQET